MGNDTLNSMPTGGNPIGMSVDIYNGYSFLPLEMDTKNFGLGFLGNNNTSICHNLPKRSSKQS